MVESRAGLFLCVTGDPIKAGLAGGMCSMKVVIIGFFPEKAKYGKMRQVNAVNGSQMVVKIEGSYYRQVKG